MAQDTFKTGQLIEVNYLAANAMSGLVDVRMEVYKNHILDVEKSIAIMIEIDKTGLYFGRFVPDVKGRWIVLVDSKTYPGKVVKTYIVN